MTTQTTPRGATRATSSLSAYATLALAAGALLSGPVLGACDGSAGGAVLASDSRDFAFTDVQTSATASFRASVGADATDALTAVSLGFVVDVVTGGPAVEVSVTPPGGSAVTSSTAETVTSSGITYDRYTVSLGDAASLCPDSGACQLDFAVVISRPVTGEAFTATATVSGIFTGAALDSTNVALDFL